mmetsp:Transcript_20014/g.29604  ORF Transcript_20014/g.29604 Transcript_20014/m.29604 type:complete len:117 (-) Transcript_20014:155-505(-)
MFKNSFNDDAHGMVRSGALHDLFAIYKSLELPDTPKYSDESNAVVDDISDCESEMSYDSSCDYSNFESSCVYLPEKKIPLEKLAPEKCPKAKNNEISPYFSFPICNSSYLTGTEFF